MSDGGTPMMRVCGETGISPAALADDFGSTSSLLCRSVSGDLEGKTCVFVEDLDHRVGKGIISAVEFDGAGPKGRSFPVLEEPWHLSYPFLIEHDDDLWMIPESSQRRDVALYKCVRFPDKWERHSTLLSGFELADATITRHNGMNYLFGAWRDGRADIRTRWRSFTPSIYWDRGCPMPAIPLSLIEQVRGQREIS